MPWIRDATEIFWKNPDLDVKKTQKNPYPQFHSNFYDIAVKQ